MSETRQKKRTICVFTGGRSDYGLLRPLMDEIKQDQNLRLKVLVSGMHLSAEFGWTYRQIEKDGFFIDQKVKIPLNPDVDKGMGKSIGVGIIRFVDALKELNPDILVVLGDRFEALAVAIAAMTLRIPIMHLYGGEASWGMMDEAMRHSITKMSVWHCTATEVYRNRVIQLGEHPRRVFNVGALGIDNIKKMKLLSKEDLEKALGVKFQKRNILVSYHPVTLEGNTAGTQFKNLLSVLEKLEDTFIVFTKSNADFGGRLINQMIDKYVSEHAKRSKVFVSMGQLNYLSTMKFVDAVVGNSSSGLIETPCFKIGTIDIGDRQKGRIAGQSVIHCSPTKASIKKVFEKLYSVDFQRALKRAPNLYGEGNAAGRIKKILKESSLKDIIKKEFYDIQGLE
ncbi:MAG: UDP-N-acetylglucosamine 2-epimerase (hydrolyzing) [Candidatus Omnitrophica bacterium]|nr:UDP-N-acetylglucosamine 2-epimerase (hydrolyzing) [Candidatus Omnitrophota bacterium]